MGFSTQELEKMQSVNIGAVDADTLPDVSGMAFDPALPREERIARFSLRDKVSRGIGILAAPSEQRYNIDVK